VYPSFPWFKRATQTASNRSVGRTLHTDLARQGRYLIARPRFDIRRVRASIRSSGRIRVRNSRVRRNWPSRRVAENRSRATSSGDSSKTSRNVALSSVLQKCGRAIRQHGSPSMQPVQDSRVHTLISTSVVVGLERPVQSKRGCGATGRVSNATIEVPVPGGDSTGRSVIRWENGINLHNRNTS
jgi:hypothetical protein